VVDWAVSARWLLPVAVLLACGPGRTERPPAAQPARPSTPGAVVDLVPLTGFSGSAPSWRLHADGRIETVALDEAGRPTGAWLPGPRLAADGTIRFPRPPFPQEVTARVTAGGEIRPCPGQPPWGRIEGDRVTAAWAKEPWLFRIDAAGTMTINGGRPPERIEGAVDARSRRTALIVYAAFYLGLSAGYVGEGGTTWCP